MRPNAEEDHRPEALAPSPPPAGASGCQVEATQVGASVAPASAFT
jgi:hypothetical protein